MGLRPGLWKDFGCDWSAHLTKWRGGPTTTAAAAPQTSNGEFAPNMGKAAKCPPSSQRQRALISHLPLNPSVPKLAAPRLAPDKAAEFREIGEARFPLFALGERLGAGLVGLGRARQALAVALLSLADSPGARNRCHVLLYGVPGSAKTSLCQAAADVVEAEIMSPRMSPAALSYDFRNGQIGALGLAHRTGFFLIDELEKVAPETLVHLFGAMETGKYTVAGKRGPLTVPASVRVLATANEIESLPAPLLDRFDFRIRLARPSPAVAERIVRGLVDQASGNGIPTAGNDFWWRQYKAWCERFTPGPPTVLERSRIRAALGLILRSLGPDAPTDLRRLASVLRVGKVLARIRRGPLTVERVIEAASVTFPSVDFGPSLSALRKLWRLPLEAA